MLTSEIQSCAAQMHRIAVQRNERCHFVPTGSDSSLVLCCRNNKMAQLVRNLLDSYHDIMNNKSGGLTLWKWRLHMYVTRRECRLITDVLCHEDGSSRFFRNVIIP
jgi:hypothetical protein